MSRRQKFYVAAFLGCITVAAFLAVMLTDADQWKGMAVIIALYGLGMYFQGRWHESDTRVKVNDAD